MLNVNLEITPEVSPHLEDIEALINSALQLGIHSDIPVTLSITVSKNKQLPPKDYKLVQGGASGPHVQENSDSYRIDSKDYCCQMYFNSSSQFHDPLCPNYPFKKEVKK